MTTAERIIKKYANRRLYDAAASRHVTLDDLRKLILEGERIKVVDDKTGEDLTRTILLQIIADQEQFGQPMLSTPTLESIIRFYGDAMQGFMSRFLEQSVASFVSQQGALQNQLTRMISGSPLGSLTDMAQNNMALWQQMQDNLGAAFRARGGVGGAGPEATGSGNPPPAEPTSSSSAEGMNMRESAADTARASSASARRPRRAKTSRK